jgi:hypothetical protein
MKVRFAIAALAVVAAAALAPRLQAEERRAPTRGDVVRTLAAEPRLVGAALTDLDCVHRPSALFGDNVFRCHVELVHESGASERLMRVLAGHERGWSVAAR